MLQNLWTKLKDYKNRVATLEEDLKQAKLAHTQNNILLESLGETVQTLNLALHTAPSVPYNCPVTRFPFCKTVPYWDGPAYIAVYGGPEYAYPTPSLGDGDQFLVRAYDLNKNEWLPYYTKTGLFLVRDQTHGVKH